MKAPAEIRKVQAPARPVVEQPDEYRTIRNLIWLYFWLLIFEGSLRKWVLPGLAGPLLIVRDPVVIAIYMLAITKGIFPMNGFVVVTFALALANLFISFVVNPEHPIVTIFGLRANFLHLPLIYVIPSVLRYQDLRRIGYWMLILAVPMAVLVFRQFQAPPDAWINKGAGEGAKQLGTTFGKIRAAGTFSYSTGLTSYAALLGGFLFFQFFKGRVYPKWLTAAGMLSLFAIVTLSGSRSNLAGVSVVMTGGLLMSLYKPKLLKGSAGMIAAIGIVYLAVGSYTVFREGQEVISERVVKSGGVKVGIIDRFLNALIPFDVMSQAPLLGNGVGMGTNAAAGMLTGERAFLLAEDEWDRVILESGPLLGAAYILLRIGMILHLWTISLAALNRGRTLPSILFFVSAIPLLNGQFGQPTMLGFAVFTSGLCLAAASAKSEGEESVEDAVPGVPQLTAAAVPAPRLARGRSAYAERLHG
jgi:hypothetical protein